MSGYLVVGRSRDPTSLACVEGHISDPGGPSGQCVCSASVCECVNMRVYKCVNVSAHIPV